jgi:hypothetical protein
MLFNWLKNRVRQAIVEGVSEAVDLLEQGDDKALPHSLAVKLLPAASLPATLPPAVESESAPMRTRKKAE